MVTEKKASATVEGAFLPRCIYKTGCSSSRWRHPSPWLTNTWFQSETSKLLFKLFAGPRGTTRDSRDNHGSSHTRILAPSPTSQPSPFLRIFLPARIPLHPWEALEGAKLFKKDSWPQYFPRKTLEISEEGCFKIIQLSLARRESLNATMSRNPRPPAFFGLVSLFHETQLIFLTSGLSSHQNRVSCD
ncbi:unnamed protein product [Cochlearia groenlandica]